MKIVTPNHRTSLLLDSSWMPINIITARACFQHFLKGRICGLDQNKNPYNFEKWNDELSGVLYEKNTPCIRSVKDAWPLPTIVIVTEKFFRKQRKREYSFQELCRYYKNTCRICLNRFSRKDLSIDHVIPKNSNGTNMTENLTIACKKCNARKGHQTPYYDTEGKLLKGTNLPSNYIFVEEHDMRNEWKDFIWH